MKRTKKRGECIVYDMPPADAILTSDWHLREDTPVARKDDFQKTQWDKIDFISDLQKEHNCPVIHAGDLFNVWKPSPALISKAIEHIPKNFYTIYGNHDLPQHNLELAWKSGIYTLEKAKVLKVLKATHWNHLPEEPSLVLDNRKILVWHVLIFQGSNVFGDFEYQKSSSVIRKYKKYDLILTGDNHIPFVEEHNGRLLVNPGSIFRMTAKQIDHKPRVYLYYADTNTVEPVYLPIVKKAISDEHIKDIKARDKRIDAFISKLDNNFESTLSFQKNLEMFLEKNKIEDKVIEILEEVVDEIK